MGEEQTPLSEKEIDEKISVKMFDSSSTDQLTSARGKCLESNCEVRKYLDTLKECTKRVNRKIAFTAETCHEETVDLIHALDKCVNKKAFIKLT